MAPARAILEALGAQVEYDDATKTVTAALDGKTLRHVIGTETVEVYAGGDMSQEPAITVMDCCSYLSGGRTMVPVRFFSEALGYIVEWDSNCNTVVLVDLDALSDAYDTQLQVLNLVLSDAISRMESGKTYRQTGNMDLDLTLFDTLNGDQKFAASAKLDQLYNETAQNITLELDLTDVVALLEAEMDAFTMQESAEILPLLRQLELNAIYNHKTQQLYLQSPLFDALLGRTAWIQQNLTGSPSMYWPDRSPTVSSLVLQNVVYSWTSPACWYGNVTAALDELITVAGDNCFTKSGSTYTYNSAALASQLGADLEDALYWAVDGYYGSDWTADFRFQVTDTGNGTCNYTGNLYFRCEVMELDLDLQKRSSSDSFSLGIHLRNMFESKLTATSSTRETQESVQTEPPATEVSMDLEEVYS